MSAIHSARSSPHGARSTGGARPHMARPALANPQMASPPMLPVISGLPDADRRSLETLLEGCDATSVPLPGQVHRHKGASSRTAPGGGRSEAVIGGARVTYSVGDGPAQLGLLSHRARRAADTGVIPVGSPLGAALIGLRIGQRAQMMQDDGSIVSICVLDFTLPG